MKIISGGLPADSELAVLGAQTGDFSSVDVMNASPSWKVAMRRLPNPPTDQDVDTLLEIFRPRCPVPLNRQDGREIYEGLDALFSTLCELRTRRSAERGAA